MKDLIRNPIFYYIIIPVLIAVWPIWLAMGGNASAKEKFNKERRQFQEAEQIIDEILKLDPQRLDYAKAKKKSTEFDYAIAFDQATKLCQILPDHYKLSSGPLVRSRGGQSSQDATMTIEKIGIEKFARFLSLVQFRWPSLQSTNLSLTKQKDAKNIWKADTRFKYFQQ